MYEYLEGRLAKSSAHLAILDVGGVGYKLAITTSDHTHLPQVGEKVCLYTSFIVRENEQSLYGFLEVSNRDLFETLTHISGIGPKTALALLSALPLDLLHKALLEADPALLAKVPGIGKKTAQRLLIELKGKLPVPQGVRSSGKVEDAISALINLGYSRLRAQKALKKPLEEMGDGADLGTLITAALQNI